jgi:hypothetical protein
MSPGKASRSSTELVAGFRIDRRLGESVWEAFQPELARRVALRRLEPGTRFDAAAWPERPGVVELFAVVEEPSGTYVATRFVPGARTLAELRSAPAGRRRRWLDEVASTLDGIVHGRLTEHDILIGGDGQVLVTGFGSAPAGATADDDRAVLERLRPEGRSRAWLLVPSAAALAVAVVAVVLVTAGDEEATAPPPVTAGATAFGSALAAGVLASVDCEGGVPDGGSLPCTVLQADLPGRPLVARSDGIVRSWAVRGASGRLALQVLRPVGDRFTTYNHGPMVTIERAEETHVVRANMSVPKGARFGLEVAPGAAVGLRHGVPGARTWRFFSPLRGDQRRPDTAGGEGEELLLRVDVVPRR